MLAARNVFLDEHKLEPKMTDVIDAIDKKPPRILIADDDPDIVKVLADRCLKLGFRVETASNGIQLLIKARQNHPDVIITDVNMPHLDGLTVCTHFVNPGDKPIDVVVVTGRADPETPERCESMGLFFGRKGPGFWKSIEAALIEIYPDMADRIEEQKMQSTGAEAHERPRVLLVDGDPAILTFLESRLRKYGLDTLHAFDALHAYRLALKTRPSVVITENFTRNGDAEYLLFRLRSTPATENVPVFVFTGQDLDDMTEKRLRHDICGFPGAVHIFRKSNNPEELFAALQQFCSFNSGYEKARKVNTH